MITFGGFLFANSLNLLNLLKLRALAKKVLVYESLAAILRYLIPLGLIYYSEIDGREIFIVGFLISLLAFDILSFIKLKKISSIDAKKSVFKNKDFYLSGKSILFYSISAYGVLIASKSPSRDCTITRSLAITGALCKPLPST